MLGTAATLALLDGLAVGGTDPAGAQAPARGAEPTMTTPTITIMNFGFSGDLTVAPGAVVTVVNHDSVTHTLTANGTKPAFDTGHISPGSSATFTAPSTAGSYAFHCQLHPEMHATLVVAKPATPHPSALTAPPTKTIHKGDDVHLTGRLTDAKTGRPLADAKVTLLRKLSGQASFTAVRTVRTGAKGGASATVTPPRTGQFKWRFAGTAKHKAVTSPSGRITVTS